MLRGKLARQIDRSIVVLAKELSKHKCAILLNSKIMITNLGWHRQRNQLGQLICKLSMSKILILEILNHHFRAGDQSR